jgi:hypothetical protein
MDVRSDTVKSLRISEYKCCVPTAFSQVLYIYYREFLCLDLKAGAEQVTGKHIYKEDGWIYVCLINALTLLLNGYLLDKLIGIGNIKCDTLLHDYL